MRRLRTHDRGFTLVELVVVVGIVGILAAVAVASYRHFTKRAQSVEAEVALTDISRLQQQYYAQHGSYATDLAAAGFNPVPPLKYYVVNLRYVGGSGGVAYRLYATAKENGDGSIAMVLTQFQDGRVELDKSVVAAGSVGQPGSGTAGGSSGTGTPADAGGSSGGALGDDPLGKLLADAVGARDGGGVVEGNSVHKLRRGQRVENGERRLGADAGGILQPREPDTLFAADEGEEPDGAFRHLGFDMEFGDLAHRQFRQRA